MAGALGAAAAGLGGAYLALLGRRPFPGSGLLKCAPVALLAGACAVAAPPAGGDAGRAGGGRASPQRLLAAGLLLSAGGDVALELDHGARRAGGGSPFFLAGLGFFRLAHLCYIGAFAGGRDARGVPLSLRGRAACVGTAAFAVGFLAVLWNDVGGAMRGPVAAYSASLAAMAIAAVAHRAGPGYTPRVLGAYLFVASDSLLGLRQFKFRGAPPGGAAYELAVMATYYGAQACIARALLLDAAPQKRA